jgi:molecular chaperone GrpE (heat shock protein)
VRTYYFDLTFLMSLTMVSEENKNGGALEAGETFESDSLDAVPEETQKTLGNDSEEADRSNSLSAIEESHSAQGQLNSDGGNPFKKFSLVGAITLGFLVALFLSSIILNVSLLTSDERAPAINTSVLNWLLVFGLLIVTAGCLTFSFWSYYARSVHLKDGPALVPEKWSIVLYDLLRHWNLYQKQSQTLLAKVNADSEKQGNQADELLNSFLTLQQALSTRDAEISRLRQGYDAKIFKRFLQRFIRIDRSLNEMVNEFEGEEGQKNYKYLSRLMEDALEECGVEPFLPEIGSDYRDAGPQVADDPKTVTTHDEAEDFTILEVETAGYVINGEGEAEVIAPSRVSILRFEKVEEIKKGE